MCGIAGSYQLDPARPATDDRIQEALRYVAHRGPDDEGIYRSDRAVLGHRRLSIIDTSAAGHQPFTDEGRRYTIVINGEIFNFQELRKGLEAQGHTFRSHSDTEVALRLYSVKGPAFLHDLNGFFALAIHDAQEDTLFLARDRFGVKPLWWCEQDGRFLFASELRALQALGAQGPVDPVSLRTYFTYHYIPAPFSILQGVWKLEPGHQLQVDARGAHKVRWYDLDDAVATARSAGDPKDRLRELMDDAVRLRLIADVPTGTFLSGGLDSSIVSALAIRHKPDLETFSIGYREKHFDETRYAEAVARHIGSRHHTITLGTEDLAAHYVGLLACIDEPFADHSALPSFVLNRYTREHVTVALSGDGADEVFGGYRKHQAALRMAHPGVAERAVATLGPVWRTLPRSRNGRLTNTFRQLDRFARAASLSPEQRYLDWAAFTPTDQVAALLDQPAFGTAFRAREQRIQAPIGDGRDLNGLLRADLLTVLPDDMLHKVDLTSMAHALEVRTPFLDHRVVAFAFGLPAERKFIRGSGKHLVREAFRDLLPTVTLERGKQGFEVPLRSILTGPLQGEMDALEKRTTDLEAAGLRPEAVRSLIGRVRSRIPDGAEATLHAVLVYMSWWRNAGRPAPAKAPEEA
ncbi:MAG: asparagine synthase (glutamine-hydrolyzing) [Flavobacteriales bacterium]|nr:asparagine synthase (glutamine-hydrolyzing) [Flavobacteriales bacterium]